MEKFVSKSWVCCLFIGLFTFAIWSETIRFDFVWDDLFLVQNNQSIRSLKNVPAIFSSVRAQSAELAPSFRPLRTTFYALLYALDGQPTPQPWIFHLANVLWHAVAAMLLFVVALLFFQGSALEPSLAARVTALLVALGFAVDPIVSEAVCWVKCLDDLMAAVFVLASLRALLRWRGGARGYLSALVFYFLADLSKESAVPFALAVTFIFAGFHRFPWRRSLRLTVPFLLTAGVYVVYRHLVIGKSEQCPPLSGNYVQTLIDMLPVGPEYLRLLWGIPPFTIDYNFMVGAPPHAFFSAAVLSGVALILAAGIAAIYLWRRDPSPNSPGDSEPPLPIANDKFSITNLQLPKEDAPTAPHATMGNKPSPPWRLAAFGILWVGLFLLPVANLVPMMQYMAERFLYLPLVGFLLALGALAIHLPRRNLAAVGAGALILLWADFSHERLAIWQDEVKLFVQSSLDNPSCIRLHENAVIAIFNQRHMRFFFELDPATHKLIYNNHPAVSANAEAMLHTLTQAHSIFPDEHRFTMALGITCALSGEASNAVPLLELATHQATERQGTNDPDCWVDLGAAYAAEKNWPKAQQSYETALRMEATNVFALHRYAQLCYDLGEYKPAQAAVETLEKLEPTNTENTRLLRDIRTKIGQ